ncbi:hypothetical protein C1I95_30810 [Micromonospora craterilacus]|uniref:Uncharacterized protein n=1 Tax=Micromonospora craterilacus TaxID=1655439 RepID=A0A2W2D6P6_9ACTN|nr:hypothetical protein [Micromonospora craterilacus]PZG07646.1 hypothetical protein C1I95_30810 [Micromonospora craterilacus]
MMAATAGGRLRQRWPAALGVLVAAGTALGLDYGGQAASVVAASGFVYLAAAATGRPGAAWPAFGVTFVLVGLGLAPTGFDPVPWLCVAALGIAIFGFVRAGWRPAWSLPLQSAAMLALGAAALLALKADHVTGGVIVSVALFGHAAWDVWHHRTGRVVVRSLAEFCGVLDVLLGVGVLVVTLTM